jgi:peptidylprolyl isomerase
VKRLGSVLSIAALVPLVAAVALVGTTLPATAAPDPLSKVTVSGAADQQPSLKFTTPFAVKQAISKVVTAGTGAKLAKGDKVTFNYYAVDGRTGKQIESSFGQSAATISLDPKTSLPPLVKALIGVKVGGRTLLAIAPKEGVAAKLAQQGAPATKDDTLLFVVDVTGVRAPLARAKGDTVAPVDGLPKVKLAKNGTPTITTPKTAAPTQLVVQPLVKGTGPAVEAGQTVNVHYVGAIWATGKVFDSSWKRKTPIDFTVGNRQVIAGWDEGLVGQTVGSQVLLVVPPDKGYGSAGQPPAIKGTDTLVFVVDILDAY